MLDTKDIPPSSKFDSDRKGAGMIERLLQQNNALATLSNHMKVEAFLQVVDSIPESELDEFLKKYK